MVSYPAEYFARTRTYSAFDMLALLPGYTFIDSDADIRGYAGAAGNVLIDGSRPASKYESLETILRRIPVSAVERIELIRTGAPGIDMQGYMVLANVIRSHGVEARGSLEIGSDRYQRGLDAPRVAGELALRSGDRLIELSGSTYQTIDDEYGAGRPLRVSTQGELLRDGSYVQDETERVTAMAAGYENAAFDGKLRLHGSAQRTRFQADVLEELAFPATRITAGSEFSDETSSELGLRFERGFASVSQLELLAIRRDVQARGGERSVSADQSSLFRDDTAASESILRTLLRHPGDSRTLEWGMEVALNTLDSRSSLAGNDIIVEVPSSDVEVEERRVEAFVTSQWNLGSAWHVELGVRFERSELALSGDSTSSRTFSFPKPRALVSWSRGQDQVRLQVEREVGQLEFADFASSASLSEDTVTAGNPDLEPDRTWRAELAWERRLRYSGAMTLTVRHEEIEALIDRIPVASTSGELFDSIGNIGTGSRHELEIDFTVPLEFVGVPAAVLKATALWRDGTATDPVTGRPRPISDDEPFEASLNFVQALPQWNLRWGIDLRLAEYARTYRFDEVRIAREDATLDVFVEYEPAPSWNVRLFAGNLTDRSSELRREVYDGPRNSVPLEYIDTRRLAIGTYAGILLRRSFGE